jgi:hypothetical protein
MQLIIDESEKKRILLLYEQWLKNLNVQTGLNPISNKLTNFWNVYNVVIPNMAKNTYKDDPLKLDAFRHILASAYFTTYIGPILTWVGGEVNEILGAFRSLLEGGGFDSGWDMDSKNNEIGIDLGKKNPKSNLDHLSKLSKNIVDSGKFYNEQGKLVNNGK